MQDFAATLPARLLGDVAGKAVIDLCAAPGGKTAQLAAAGADVTAVDVSSDRLALIAGNLARLKLHAELVAADARDWRPPAPAALCSFGCALHVHRNDYAAIPTFPGSKPRPTFPYARACSANCSTPPPR